jgi:dTDP-glucose pyrophosphorylase
VASDSGLHVSPSDALRVAHGRIRTNGYGIVAVVDGDGRVQGVLDDATLRRAVLSGVALDDAVSGLSLTTPLTVSKRTSRDDVLDLLRAHRLRAVPVVVNGKLSGIRSVDEYGERPRGVAVVMVGGEGQRLRPLTDKVPKPLLKIGGQSIVERLIDGLARAGVREVYLTLNYKASMFEERLGSGEHLGVKLHYVRERKAMGTAGALSLLPHDLDGPIVVVNGDIVTTLDFRAVLDFHWHHEGAITVAGVEHLSPIPYGVLQTVRHHLLGIEEKPQRRDLIAAGIYVLQPALTRFVPANAPFGMPDLIERATTEGLPVHVFPIIEKWFDIGSPEEFERVLMQFALGEEQEEHPG